MPVKPPIMSCHGDECLPLPAKEGHSIWVFGWEHKILFCTCTPKKEIKREHLLLCAY